MFYADPHTKLGYIPIHKNASSTFINLFQRNRWHRFNLDKIQSNDILFSHIQNPWQRYIKGLTEMAWLDNERSFTIVRRKSYFKAALLNPHIMPISIMTHGYTDRIHFIPIDFEVSAVDLTNQFLEQHKSKLRTTEIDRLHSANLKKQAYKKEVETWVNTKHPYSKQVKLLLTEDFKLYRDALDHYKNPVIPQSWFHRSLKRIWTSA